MYRFSRHSRWQSQRGSFIARNTKVWSTQRRIRSKQCVPMSKTVTKTTEEHFLVLYLLMPTMCSTTHVVRGVGGGGGGGGIVHWALCSVQFFCNFILHNTPSHTSQHLTPSHTLSHTLPIVADSLSYSRLKDMVSRNPSLLKAAVQHIIKLLRTEVSGHQELGETELLLPLLHMFKEFITMVR